MQRRTLVDHRRCQADEQPDHDTDDVRHEEGPEHRPAQATAVAHAARPLARSGTRPVTSVPRLGAEVTASEPPSAATLSTMFPSPEPGRHCSGSKPDPSSRTEKTRWPSSSVSRTETFAPAACFAALLSASRQAKE